MTTQELEDEYPDASESDLEIIAWALHIETEE